MAYMMAKLSFTFDSSIDHIATKRKVQPNFGFLTQLQLYEDMKHNLHGNSPSHVQYLQIKRSSLLADVRHKWAGKFSFKLKTQVEAEREAWAGPYTGDIISEASSDPISECYVCKSCGKVLVHPPCLLQHESHTEVIRGYFGGNYIGNYMFGDVCTSLFLDGRIEARKRQDSVRKLFGDCRRIQLGCRSCLSLRSTVQTRLHTVLRESGKGGKMIKKGFEKSRKKARMKNRVKEVLRIKRLKKRRDYLVKIIY
jgi:hypothetical protein